MSINAIVYVMTHKINGKRYIGSTTCLMSERLKAHVRYARRRSTEFYIEIDDNGIEIFDVEIIECLFEDRLKIEFDLIKTLNPYYNTVIHKTNSRPLVYPNGSILKSIRMDRLLVSKILEESELTGNTFSKIVNETLYERYDINSNINQILICRE